MKRPEQSVAKTISYVVTPRDNQSSGVLKRIFETSGVTLEESGSHMFCQVPQDQAQEFISAVEAHQAGLELEFKPLD